MHGIGAIAAPHPNPCFLQPPAPPPPPHPLHSPAPSMTATSECGSVESHAAWELGHAVRVAVMSMAWLALQEGSLVLTSWFASLSGLQC